MTILSKPWNLLLNLIQRLEMMRNLRTIK